MEPSFFLSYWRPWNEDSSLIDSWGDYLRDTSLVDYGTKKIGSFIQQASRDNVRAIEEASQMQAKATVASGMMQAKAIEQASKMIGFKIDGVSNELKFLNRRLDIAVEQQRINQLNLEELLSIPDSEKERMKTIKTGIHFFMASSNDPDLFDDALEEFMKALDMKKQDYFVLHKIGCIYLFSQKHLDPEKALDYFIRAGKYAAADCLTNSSVGSEKLKGDFNYIDSTSDRKHIRLLAADSYDKAALTSYILGDDSQAVHFQELAVKNHREGKNLFNLAKYQFRIGDNNAINRLNDAVELDPDMLNAIFCDADIVSSTLIPDFVNKKWAELGNDIEEAIIEQLSTDYYNDAPSYRLKHRLPDSAYKFFVKEKKYSEAKRLMSIYGMDKRDIERIAKMDSELTKAGVSLLRLCKSEEERSSVREALSPSFLQNVKSIDDYDEIYGNTLAFIKSYKSN